MDPRLVIRAQEGDETAFAAITQAIGGRLHRVALRILRNQHAAEDATQQALVDIWRKLPTLRDPSRFDAWSYRFVVNACSDEARRRKRSLPDLHVSREPVTPSPASIVDDRDQLERGFERLSMDHRAVIVLHHYLDLTLEDTATALGISTGTAKSRLNRAMTKLRMALEADSPNPGTVPLEATR
jgi:RNA polymerase sigma-70 factor (ECF subfamily)